MNTIGLAKGTVKLVPYDSSWPAIFAAEVKRLRQKLGIDSNRIQHVGSTSIPGVLAKPIIDIVILVDTLDVVDAWVRPLADLDYWNKGPEPKMPDRRFFAKGPEDKRTVYLHVVTPQEYQKLIAFRDALRADKKHAQEYSDLKAKLANELQNDRARYTSLKNDFIQHVLQSNSERQHDTAKRFHKKAH